MDTKRIMQILEETAYIRVSGTPAERKAAEQLVAYCAELGLEARLESFPVDMGAIQRAELWCDGEQVPCTGYACGANGEIEAPLYYLNNTDPWSLAQCRGKIVLSDKMMTHAHYKEVRESGAVGFITYNGNVNFPDTDLEQRELRGYVSEGNLLPGANLHSRTAVSLIEKGVKTAKLVVEGTTWQGESTNVILDLPGETEEFIIFSAHFDTTPLSTGVWDNMSGCVGLLMLAEHFAKNPHRYGMRFVWCGSEERGLLGSKAYAAAHEEELKQCVLNINLDMIGCIMGPFRAVSTAEEKLVHYVSYLGMELGFGVDSSQGVYPSDSTPFADKGVPAITFARSAPGHTASIHNRYDTIAIMKGEQMVEDLAFVTAFAERMANARHCPVSRTIPENMKEKLDEYMCRKAAKK